VAVDFDYVVVGAGSAGCVLAEALTASGRHRVLVLEAGGTDRRFWIQVPLGYGKTFYDRRVTWAYETEPDPGLGGRTDYWPRGRVLGGSSSINAMVYVRGAAEDYDDWEAVGNPGWGWRDVLACYKRLEDNQAGGDDYRGAGGPLRVTDVSTQLHPLCRTFLEAALQAGLPLNRDFNGAQQEGVGFYQITTRGGRRLSAARAFLHPAMRRPNLKVETGALATRVLFEGRRASGVEYIRGGRTVLARAKREVVLCGGAINSPQLLLLSGIGPAEHLRDLGIAPLLDNGNVGAHLQDHIGLNYTYRARQATLNTLLRPWWGKLWVGSRYLALGSGPLSLSLNQCGGFFRTGPDKPRPNMQLYFQALTTLTPKEGERPLLTPDDFPGFSIGLSSCRPTSRGSLVLRSAEPFAPPRITANCYDAPEDLEEMLDAVKFLRKLAAMPPLAAVIEAELLPGPDCTGDEALIEDLRARSGTVFHPSGTCRMGPTPESAVVDPRLRVHGVEALRVVDASVFPSLISGNTNAPAMMVGAQGAGFILEDAR
jgi:choline dehydrogenase